MLRRIYSPVVVGLAYFAAASVAIAFTRFGGRVALFWAATAILLPVLAAKPSRRWLPDLAAAGVASMAASTLFGDGAIYAPLFAAALLAEAAIGAAMLRRALPDGRYFDTTKRVAVYVLAVGGVMPLLSATMGAAAGTIATGVPYMTNFTTWFAGHALGTLSFSPLVVLLRHEWNARHDGRRWVTLGLVDVALLVLTAEVDLIVFTTERVPLLFVPLLPLVFMTFRLGRVGAAVSVGLLAVIGGTATTLGVGPLRFVDGSIGDRVLFFQLYLASTVVMILPVAAALNQRDWLSRRVQESAALFKLMADQAGDILFHIAPDGRVRYVSPAIERVGGHAPHAVVGRSCLDLIVPEDRALVAARHAETLADPDATFIFEYRAIRGDGSVVWFETHSRAIAGDDGRVTGVVNTVRDVSHRKSIEFSLADAARTDALTGLGNRRVFEERLALAVAQANTGTEVGCLAVLDIDHFKRINDSHGHPAGDEVLRQVAQALRERVRANDTVARIGGEEFGLIFRDMDPTAAASLCERLREAVADLRVHAGGAAITVTVSIGLARITGPNAADLLGATDAALYVAKRAGRNRLRLVA